MSKSLICRCERTLSDQANVTSGFWYRRDPKNTQTSPLCIKIQLFASLCISPTLINVMNSSKQSLANMGREQRPCCGFIPLRHLKGLFNSVKFTFIFFGLILCRVKARLKCKGEKRGNFHPNFHTRSGWSEGDSLVLLNIMGKIFHLSNRTFQC